MTSSNPLLTGAPLPAFSTIEPGHVQPAVDTPELRAISPNWGAWVDDHALVTQEPSLRRMLERAGAVLIGFRELRQLMR